MRAKIAVLMVLFTSSSPAFSQLIGTQDTTAAGIVMGGAMHVYGRIGLEELDRKLQYESGQFEREIKIQNQQIKELLEQAKTIEVGQPNSNTRSLYTGKYVEASEYEKFAGEEKQMKSNAYRLQGSGAEKIAAALLEETELQGKKITLTLKRVHGTSNATIINMASSTVLEGSVQDVTAKMIAAANAQSATSAPNSIVRVELEYKTPGTPNPEAAAKLRTKAATMEKKVAAEAPKVAEEVAKVEKKYASAIKRMKAFKYGGPAVIAGAFAFGFVRYSFAQDMMSLAQACADADQLNTLTTTIAVQTEFDADEVAYELRELCAR